MEIPLRHERVEGLAGAEQRIRSAGWIRRSSLEVSPGFRGKFTLDLRAESTLEPDDRLAAGSVESEMSFEAESGTRIHSKLVARIRCRDCASAPEVEPLEKQVH